jgi:hypothetical protein
MSDFTDAKQSLLDLIASNKTFLSNQDAPATLTATFADLTTILHAIKQWAQAVMSYKGITSTSSEELQAELLDSQIQSLLSKAQSFFSHYEELKTLVGVFAAKARE